MRELTFKGFLRQYVKKLSYSDTLNLEKLAMEVKNGNHRLRAPLLLFAAVSGRSRQLSDALESAENASELRRLFRILSAAPVEQSLRSGNAPEAYLKVWNSYLVAHDAPARDEALKDAMRKKVLRLQKEKGCSNYRLYTDLKLNPGNVNSWLYF